MQTVASRFLLGHRGLGMWEAGVWAAGVVPVFLEESWPGHGPVTWVALVVCSLGGRSQEPAGFCLPFPRLQHGGELQTRVTPRRAWRGGMLAPACSCGLWRAQPRCSWFCLLHLPPPTSPPSAAEQLLSPLPPGPCSWQGGHQPPSPLPISSSFHPRLHVPRSVLFCPCLDSFLVHPRLPAWLPVESRTLPRPLFPSSSAHWWPLQQYSPCWPALRCSPELSVPAQGAQAPPSVSLLLLVPFAGFLLLFCVSLLPASARTLEVLLHARGTSPGHMHPGSLVPTWLRPLLLLLSIPDLSQATAPAGPPPCPSPPCRCCS